MFNTAQLSLAPDSRDSRPKQNDQIDPLCLTFLQLFLFRDILDQNWKRVRTKELSGICDVWFPFCEKRLLELGLIDLHWCVLTLSFLGNTALALEVMALATWFWQGNQNNWACQFIHAASNCNGFRRSPLWDDSIVTEVWLLCSFSSWVSHDLVFARAEERPKLQFFVSLDLYTVQIGSRLPTKIIKLEDKIFDLIANTNKKNKPQNEGTPLTFLSVSFVSHPRFLQSQTILSKAACSEHGWCRCVWKSWNSWTYIHVIVSTRKKSLQQKP